MPLYLLQDPRRFYLTTQMPSHPWRIKISTWPEEPLPQEAVERFRELSLWVPEGLRSSMGERGLFQAQTTIPDLLHWAQAF